MDFDKAGCRGVAIAGLEVSHIRSFLRSSAFALSAFSLFFSFSLFRLTGVSENGVLVPL